MTRKPVRQNRRSRCARPAARYYQKECSLVSQDIYLFIGTIADNIRYAKPDATMDEIIAAAKAASAHDFIMKLPDAYETRVGAGGHDLSGGERQRISIARTIIQNPRILILDEATAAMDTETERNIQYSLTKTYAGQNNCRHSPPSLDSPRCRYARGHKRGRSG